MKRPEGNAMLKKVYEIATITFVLNGFFVDPTSVPANKLKETVQSRTTSLKLKIEALHPWVVQVAITNTQIKLYDIPNLLRLGEAYAAVRELVEVHHLTKPLAITVPDLPPLLLAPTFGVETITKRALLIRLRATAENGVRECSRQALDTIDRDDQDYWWSRAGTYAEALKNASP